MSASPTVLPVRISGPFCYADQHRQQVSSDQSSVSYCIKRNGQRTTRHLALGFSGMVDDGLVVFVCSVGEVHAYDVEPSFPQHIDLFHRIGLWAYTRKSAKLIRSGRT